VALYLPLITLFKVNFKTLGTFTITVPLAIIFFDRAFDGLSGGNISVAYAYVADITEEKDRNRNFARIAITSNLGFIIGPALAGILSVTDYGYAIPVVGAITISFIGVLLIIFYIPENKECAIKKSENI
jgi:MFS family permease